MSKEQLEANDIYDAFYEYEVHPISVESRKFVARKHALMHVNKMIETLNNLSEYDVLVNQSITSRVLSLVEVAEILEKK